MKRFHTRFPRLMAYSRNYGQGRIKPPQKRSYDRVNIEGLFSLLQKLKEGIAFEQSKGHQNWPGQKQIFSDFLNETLRTIESEYCNNLDGDMHAKLTDVLRRTTAYSSLTEQNRAKVLGSLKCMIDEINKAEQMLEDISKKIKDPQSLNEGDHNDAIVSGSETEVDMMACNYIPFVIDLEATDLSIKTSHIVEICAINLFTRESFYRRVRLPENVYMHLDAERVTGISSADLKGQGVPTFREVIDDFFKFIQNSVSNDESQRYDGIPLLIGHNILNYDIPLLKSRIADLGMVGCFEGFEYLDTLKVSRKLFKDCPSYRLGSLYNFLTQKSPENSHSALGDVLTTVEILECLLDRGVPCSMTSQEKSRDSWSLLFKRLDEFIQKECSRYEGAVKDSTKHESMQAEKHKSTALSRDDLLDMGLTTMPNLDENIQHSGTSGKSVLAELSKSIKETGDLFAPAEKKMLTQMQCQTFHDILHCFPKAYLSASVGTFPCLDVSLDQAIVLPVHLESIKIIRGKFHVLNARFRCMNLSDLESMRHNPPHLQMYPILEYKVFRKGRSAGWAIMNEEKRLRSLGNVFAISAKVSVDPQGSFLIKDKTLEMLDLKFYKSLDPSGVYLRPLYPQKGQKSSQVVSELVSKALDKLQEIQNKVADPLPADIRKRHNIQRYVDAIKQIHKPDSIGHFAHARYSIAFQELFFLQLRLLWRSCPRESVSTKVQLHLMHQKMAIDTLNFPLTNDQVKALDCINEAFARKNSASIFLQGDVGCGKTIVALLSAIFITSNGQQVAFMAPTEVLAEQHMKSLKSLISNPKLPKTFRTPTVALLTGSTKSGDRSEILKRLASGDIDIIVGTHALISAPVQFQHLGLAIIDEQHKFGVEQRAAMLSKSNPAPHLLNMSATPIPRSLALVLYGEMELIEIKEMPPGRIPVKTQIWSEDGNTRQKLINEMKKEIDRSGKCFIICPLIDAGENDENGMRTAISEKERLCSTQELDASSIGLLHGRMGSPEKEEILSSFADPNGSLKILISTTVVEVGVNVPDATLMIIEHAERFGLAQLHQLRGRVGRGSRESKCILVTNTISSDRLSILEDTNDGFEVAEADLLNRGSGDILGTAQAGQANANSTQLWELPRDGELVSIARQEASSFLAEHGVDTDVWPSFVSETLHQSSTIDLDIHQLPNFTL